MDGCDVHKQTLLYSHSSSPIGSLDEHDSEEHLEELREVFPHIPKGVLEVVHPGSVKARIVWNFALGFSLRGKACKSVNTTASEASPEIGR